MWFCEHERIYQRFQDGLALAQEGDFLGAMMGEMEWVSATFFISAL